MFVDRIESQIDRLARRDHRARQCEGLVPIEAAKDACHEQRGHRRIVEIAAYVGPDDLLPGRFVERLAVTLSYDCATKLDFVHRGGVFAARPAKPAECPFSHRSTFCRSPFTARWRASLSLRHGYGPRMPSSR